MTRGRKLLPVVLLLCLTWGLFLAVWPGVGRAAPQTRYFVSARYSTYLDPWQPARGANIRLAARALDGCALGPGEIFSFNRMVGARTLAAGYVRAGILANREPASGVGGGVCQVASTLYNAVLRAGLPVTERHAHSRAVAYVPPGLDAAVSYGSLDFCFKNSCKTPLLIQAAVTGNVLTIVILTAGESLPPATLQIETLAVVAPPVCYQQEAGLPAGKTLEARPGVPGYRVIVERKTWRGDRSPVTETISCDSYQPQPSLVLVGTASIR